MKRWMFVGVLILAGCASRDPAMEAQEKLWENVYEQKKSEAQSKETAKQERAASAKTEKKVSADRVKVKIETTMGNIKVTLFAKEAPKTVENFVKLANDGFYDGIIFHRVIPNFMIQTGDPTGTGMGGPGYKFEDEFAPGLTHSKPGILSMANSGPNANGSQFFITVAASTWLDNKHSIFGEVTDGMNVALEISNAARDGKDKPLTTVKMIKVTVVG